MVGILPPLIGGDSVEVLDAYVSDDAIFVVWSTDITDIFIISVTATNTNNGLNSSVAVGQNSREALIPNVDNTAPYNVSVKIYGNCQNSLSSDLFPVNKHIQSLPSSSLLESLVSTTEKTSLYLPTQTLMPTSMRCFVPEPCGEGIYIPYVYVALV